MLHSLISLHFVSIVSAKLPAAYKNLLASDMSPPPLEPPPPPISDFIYILRAIWAALEMASCLEAPPVLP